MKAASLIIIIIFFFLKEEIKRRRRQRKRLPYSHGAGPAPYLDGGRSPESGSGESGCSCEQRTAYLWRRSEKKRRKKARLCNLGLAGSGHNVQPCRSQWKLVGGTRRLAHCPAGGLQPRGDPMRCNCTRRKKGKKMTCRFSVPSCNFITKSHSLEGRIGSLQILFLISGKHIWRRNEVEIIEATRDVYGLKTRVMSQVFTAGQRGARSCIVIFF